MDLGGSLGAGNYRLTPHEVIYIAQSCRASVYVCDDIFPEHATAVANSGCGVKLIVTIGIGGSLNWEDLAARNGGRRAAPAG